MLTRAAPKRCEKGVITGPLVAPIVVGGDMSAQSDVVSWGKKCGRHVDGRPLTVRVEDHPPLLQILPTGIEGLHVLRVCIDGALNT